jgi:hypothetical protein
LLKQAKHDGNIRAYDAFQISNLSKGAVHTETSYNPDGGVYTFKFRMEDF